MEKDYINKILNVKEVAEMLQISISELRKLMAKGEISYFEIGESGSKKKAKRFKLSDVNDYINSHYVEILERVVY